MEGARFHRNNLTLSLLFSSFICTFQIYRGYTSLSKCFIRTEIVYKMSKCKCVSVPIFVSTVATSLAYKGVLAQYNTLIISCRFFSPYVKTAKTPRCNGFYNGSIRPNQRVVSADATRCVVRYSALRRFVLPALSCFSLFFPFPYSRCTAKSSQIAISKSKQKGRKSEFSIVYSSAPANLFMPRSM